MENYSSLEEFEWENFESDSDEEQQMEAPAENSVPNLSTNHQEIVVGTHLEESVDPVSEPVQRDSENTPNEQQNMQNRQRVRVPVDQLSFDHLPDVEVNWPTTVYVDFHLFVLDIRIVHVLFHLTMIFLPNFLLKLFIHIVENN